VIIFDQSMKLRRSLKATMTSVDLVAISIDLAVIIDLQKGIFRVI